MNTLDGSSLRVIMYQGFLNNNPRHFYESKFNLDILSKDKLGWSINSKNVQESTVFANEIFNKYVGIVHNLLNQQR